MDDKLSVIHRVANTLFSLLQVSDLGSRASIYRLTAVTLLPLADPPKKNLGILPRE
ncbi:MAG: hypothetical protein HQ507_06980 [Candidatus Marinimicrobia bacterium]|nr:hypothetical protein [Candidatus Neomarinimicrobiota bacterium]